MDLNWYSGVVSLLALAVTWCIVNPLKTAIFALQKSVDELRAEMKANRETIQNLEQRHARFEEKVKTLFAENDVQNSRIQELERRCNICRKDGKQNA